MADDKENSVEDLEDEKQEELTGTAGQVSKDMQSMAADPAFQSALDLEQDEIGQAMTFVTTEITKLRTNKLNREKELAKVSVSDEDIALVMKELDVSKAAAEKALRENQGSLETTLRALIA
ncbi:hypothetical protein BCR33DRAFT_808434 [Rhizoclosmatium globosum]|uniref:Nascent polypeptide-associated complex subunit alpha-like UBA domain-containing protein n=1 Tax=Rhizoclosmatium globosum TaxID=329046 RepID=A0A1Y2AP53_9FUNG|nr:hypothetical protein BCR33DRAFT_808434 [Rhizoclosmatium globosum]|eukprot:ORY24276.1 hypothetical protein BCR33DRAFT_808434 [Rhizoclosmatium globosum]